MKFAWFCGCALGFGLIAGCSQTTSEQASGVSANSRADDPEWALEKANPSTESPSADVQPIPETDDIVAADGTPPAVKPIPDDSN